MANLMLIDGNSLLFRAYYATAYGEGAASMRTSSGVPTNAVYLLANILNKILQQSAPSYALVAFDTAAPTFRHLEYHDYKAGRKETPSDLISQFPYAKELLNHFGFYTYEADGYEADDIIGTMSCLGKEAGLEVEIYSGDRDLLQLIDHNVTVYLTIKGLSELKKMDTKALFDEWELTPAQIPDLKGLMGDASDNIPGIAGVGEKTALKLLKEYKTVEQVITAEIAGKLGEKIKAQKDVAIASKRLATIDCHIPLPFQLEDTKYQGVQLSLRDFYQKMEMHSFLKKMPSVIREETQYKFVQTIPETMIHEALTLHLEMDGDNYHQAPIFGLAVSNGINCYFIRKDDLMNDSSFLSYLRNPIYEKYGYDGKRLLVGLHRLGIEVNQFVFDLLLSAYLLEPSLKEDPAVVFEYFNIRIPYRSQAYDKKAMDREAQIASYACEICHHLHTLRPQVLQQLESKELMPLYRELEMPLLFILSKMEQTGIKLELSILKEKSLEIQQIIEKITQEIYTLSGETFNINSPSQTAHVLFDTLQLPPTKKRSTAAGELDLISSFHPVVPKILDYRRYAKLQSVYLQGLPAFVMEDGKIHTIYNQALTQTGRLSSRDPNLQNITIRDEELKEVRKAFVASEKGWYIVSFDYSQIELRVLAHIANAPEMIASYRAGIDIHKATASKVFNVSEQEVTPQMRREAKVVNFGIIYGMSEWGLSEQLGIGIKEAKEFIRRYFSLFPSIKEYMDQAIKSCEELGYVRTMFGRYRYVPEIKDRNHNIREFGKRVAMNTPIQGTAADIIKVAMIKVNQQLEKGKFKTRMLLQVHDELVFEAPYEELMSVIPLIEKAMETAVELQVPLKVEYQYGFSWYH